MSRAAIVLALVSFAGAAAADSFAERFGGSSAETLKTGRVTVDPVAKTIFENGDVKAFEPAAADKASGGLTLLERMGATLPPLPAEKPFAGPVDEAYGAFQRGLFLTAMEKALPRAEKGDGAAQTLIGELLSNGLGVKRDEKGAAFWYAQGAEHGDENAMFRYAMLLMEGRGVKRDKAKSDEWMRKAADAGNPSAAFNYAQVLVGDHPGKDGLKRALPYYEKAAERGIADGQYALSQIYMSLPELGADHEQKAIYWVERAAKAGYDTAQLDLGLWLVNGTAGTRKAEEGFRWLKRAADQGNISAANKVAHLLINAVGTPPDPVEAAKWYVISRRAGLPDPALEDFFLGIEDAQQAEAIKRADAYRPRR
jgi:TPR repeat protein